MCSFISGVVLIGCGTSSIETDTVSQSSAALLTGQSLQFKTNISTKTGMLAWSVNGTVNGNASVGTIDAMGNLHCS